MARAITGGACTWGSSSRSGRAYASAGWAAAETAATPTAVAAGVRGRRCAIPAPRIRYFTPPPPRPRGIPNAQPLSGRRPPGNAQGKVLLFDDSFEHEVFHDGEGARVVLIVDAPSPRRNDRDRNSGLAEVYLPF
eukprot:COSAG01_NODE_4389_length_5071_cov_139.047246_3_plen_135_part_00